MAAATPYPNASAADHHASRTYHEHRNPDDSNADIGGNENMDASISDQNPNSDGITADYYFNPYTVDPNWNIYIHRYGDEGCDRYSNKLTFANLDANYYPIHNGDGDTDNDANRDDRARTPAVHPAKVQTPDNR